MTTFKLGAIHRKQPAAIHPLSHRASLHLMIPPPSVDWHVKCPPDHDPLANDKFGCCVPVADWRIIQMRKSIVWGDPTKPLVSDILARYATLTGFNPTTGQPDNGTDTVTDMTNWCTKGIHIADQTLDVPFWAKANPQDQVEVNLSIAHTGPVALTLALPLAAQDLSVWSKSPGQGAEWNPGTWGFHRVMTGKYDGATRVVRTWGSDVEVHIDFWKKYVVSVDVVLSRNWLTTTGLSPSGLDYDALRGDLAALA